MTVGAHRFYPTDELGRPIGRARFYTQVLRSLAAHEPCGPALDRVDGYIAGSATIEEGLVAREFETAVKGSATLVGAAWRHIEKIGRIAKSVADKRGRNVGTAIDYRPMPQLAVTMHNLAICLDAARHDDHADRRAILLLGALTQVQEVMDSTVATALAPLRSGVSFGGPEKEIAHAIEELRDLRWVPECRASLSQVRNAWAHGLGAVRDGSFELLDRASLKQGGRVVREPSSWRVKVRLTPSELESYTKAALAAQSALTFETAVSLSYSQRGRIGVGGSSLATLIPR